MLKTIGTTLLLAIIGISLIFSPLQAKSGNRVYYQNQVAVLMYHHIHDKDKSSSTITTDLFQRQLQELTNKGYRFISLSEFKQFMEGSTIPANAVLVTFDDGYQSFYTNAYPILVKMKIPAVNFIITGTLANPLASYLPYISSDQIKDMTHSASFIDAECHTDSLHIKLPNGKAALVGRIEVNGQQETDEQYRQRILQDLTACRDKLSKLTEKPIDSFAYPYGITNKEASQFLREAGFRYAFTIVSQMATRNADPLLIPRINAGSPNITPELLHRSIQRSIVAGPNNSERVAAANIVQQLGGNAVKDGDSLRIRLQGSDFTLKANSLEAARGQELIKLREPVTVEHRIILVALDDLSNLLEKELMYNTFDQKISERVPRQISK